MEFPFIKNFFSIVPTNDGEWFSLMDKIQRYSSEDVNIGRIMKFKYEWKDTFDKKSEFFSVYSQKVVSLSKNINK